MRPGAEECDDLDLAHGLREGALGGGGAAAARASTIGPSLLGSPSTVSVHCADCHDVVLPHARLQFGA